MPGLGRCDWRDQEQNQISPHEAQPQVERRRFLVMVPLGAPSSPCSATFDRLDAGVGRLFYRVGLLVRLFADQVGLLGQSIGLHDETLAGVTAGLLGLTTQALGLLIER